MQNLSSRQAIAYGFMCIILGLCAVTLQAQEDEPRLSSLSEKPDWEALTKPSDVRPTTVLAERLANLYAPGNAAQGWVQIEDGELQILGTEFHGENEEGGSIPLSISLTSLSYSTEPNPTHTRTHWRGLRGLPLTAPDRPLAGLRVALDPGHLGGKWAKMERRSFQLEGFPKIQEGDLTLRLAELLSIALREKGAEVFMIRTSSEPATPQRAEDFLGLARKRIEADRFLPGIPRDASNEEQIRLTSEMLFYRVAEIRARARLLEAWRPDVVLCLHFNAAAWEDPTNPAPVEENHLHVLVNGAYSAAELSLADQRFEMVQRLLFGYDAVEVPLARAMAKALARETGLPPFTYGGSNAVAVDKEGYVWGRNLLANRLYPAPVVFLEAHVANSRAFLEHYAMGEYAGRREVAGGQRLNVMQEYAEGILEGMRNYYAKVRCGEVKAEAELAPGIED